MRRILRYFYQYSTQVSLEAQAFIARVEADGGTVEDSIFLNQFIAHAKSNGYYDDIVAAYSPSWGVKGTTTASKLYSIIGAGQDLEQVVGANQPVITASSINGRTSLIFDGTNDYMIKSFTFNRPETVILMGFKQRTWTLDDFLFDGDGSANMALTQNQITPGIAQRVTGTFGPVENNLAVNTNGHLRCLFNHPTSNITQVDNNAETSLAIAQATEAGGLTMGARPDGARATPINISTIVLLNSAVDANYTAKMEAIYNFSKSAYGTP